LRAPGGARTPALLIRSQSLCPLSYWRAVPLAGFEPATPSVSGKCSPRLSYGGVNCLPLVKKPGEQVPSEDVGTFLLLVVGVAFGIYVGMRIGGRRALWRFHTGNYQEQKRKLKL
jgi:hypothetical protein